MQKWIGKVVAVLDRISDPTMMASEIMDNGSLLLATWAELEMAHMLLAMVQSSAAYEGRLARWIWESC